MFELGLIVLGLLVLGLFGGLILSLLGLVFKLVLLPVHLIFWLFRGVLGVALAVILLLIVLPLAFGALPVLLLIFAWPLAIIGLIVGGIRMAAGNGS